VLGLSKGRSSTVERRRYDTMYPAGEHATAAVTASSSKPAPALSRILLSPALPVRMKTIALLFMLIVGLGGTLRHDSAAFAVSTAFIGSETRRRKSATAPTGAFLTTTTSPCSATMSDGESHQSRTPQRQRRQIPHCLSSRLYSSAPPVGIAAAAAAGEIPNEEDGDGSDRSSSSLRHVHNKHHNDQYRNSNLYEFNQRLNQMAEQVSSPSSKAAENSNDNLHVIARAAACEKEWEEERRRHTDGDGADAVAVDTVSLNTVLKGWARCAQVLADNHNAMNTGARAGPPSGVTSGSNDGTYTSNEVNLHAISVSETSALMSVGLPPVYTAHDAALRALQILDEHHERAVARLQGAAVPDEGGDEEERNVLPTSSTSIWAPPDVTSYNIVMDTLAKTHGRQATEQVEKLMERLISSAQSTNVEVQLRPDVLSWTAILDAYAYSDGEDRLVKIQSAWKRIDQLFEKDPEAYSVRPTSIRILNAILYAYAHYHPPTSVTISAYDRKNMEEQKRVAYDNAMTCVDILLKSKQTYEDTKDAADQPTAKTYTTVIHALSRVGKKACTEKAQELFDELQDLHATHPHDDRFQPTVNTYFAMILSWARTRSSQSPLRAEELLHRLLEEAEGKNEGGTKSNSKLRPTAKVFTAVIQAWTRSHSPQKAARVLKLLQQMKALAANHEKYPNVAPTLVAYQTALDACSRVKGTVEQETAALKIAFAIFKSIERDNMQPNHVVYATLLKATGALMSHGDERNSISRAVFGKAVASGQADVSVVKALQKSSDSSVQHELLEPITGLHGEILYNKVPEAWTKNVKI